MEFFMVLPVIAIVFLALGFRLLAGSFDRNRIRAYIEERGGQLLSSVWAPFGRGWFGEKSDRIYEVRYLDQDGNEHDATCKTGVFTGVYFTEDTIVSYSRHVEDGSENRPDISELERENQRLREELRKANQNRS